MLWYLIWRYDTYNNEISCCCSSFYLKARTHFQTHTQTHSLHLSHVYTTPPQQHPPSFYSQTARVPTAPKPLLKPLLTSHVTRPCLSFWIRPSFPALAQRAKRLIGTETMVQCRHNKQWPVGAVCLRAASSPSVPCMFLFLLFPPLYSYLSLFLFFLSLLALAQTVPVNTRVSWTVIYTDLQG